MTEPYTGPDRRQDHATRNRINDIQLWLIRQQRKILATFVLQIAILMAQAIVFTVQIKDVRDQSAEARTAAALGQCRRVNNLRHQTNLTEAAVYLTIDQAARATSAGTEVAQQYRRFARAVAFTGDTNCAEAVRHPLKYKAPEPIPYHKFPKSFAASVIADPQHSPPVPPHRP